MKFLVLVCVLGAATCNPAGGGRPVQKSGRQRSAPSSIRDHQLSASTYASHEDFYDDVSNEAEHYHGEDDSSEYDSDGKTAYSNDKAGQNQWSGPVAQPPGYHSDGSPRPVEDLPEVVAERQKHLHLFSYGPHAGAVAAAHKVHNAVPGGFSSPWVPIIDSNPSIEDIRRNNLQRSPNQTSFRKYRRIEEPTPLRLPLFVVGKSLRGAFLQNHLILIHDLNNVRKPQTWPIIRGTCYKSR
ncbi:hypothetical protein GE061_014728 [Apolygus lucorum]|uniref:Secreted protein n=1 Tax=Apolygus lucorum TaxID=248454 RepID=A0A8S9XN21_APOLU|nr:hypothetical protein GE061_014728 [Apolygus lucorum]